MTFEEIGGIPNYADIIDLLREEWPPEFGEATNEEILKHFREHHNERTDTVKFLYDEEKVIGFYRYTLWPRSELTTNIAHILDISILPSYRRKGLGSLLMEDLIQDCKEKGIIRLMSRSYKTNAGSIALHRSLGFTNNMETKDSIVWELDIKETKK